MKRKLSLLFAIMLVSFSVQAQFTINQPAPEHVCDINNDGTETFYLPISQSQILGTLSPNDYTLTFHLTQTDAVAGINPLPIDYTVYTTTQIVYIRVTDNSNFDNYQLTTMELVLDESPQNPTVTLTNCSSVITSFPCWNLDSIIPSITQNNQLLTVAFYQTQTDAATASNQIANTGCYISPVAAPTQPPIYYTSTNIATGCRSMGIVNLTIINCSNCELPATGIATVTQSTAEVILDASNQPNIAGWEVVYQPSGGPPPNQGVFVPITTNLYSITGLYCGTSYEVYVRSICSYEPYNVSQWSVPQYFLTQGCGPQYGQPQSFHACVDGANTACFNLTDNDIYLIGTQNPAEHTITYHASPSEAEANQNPLSSPYCVGPGQTTVFARVAKNDGSFFFTSAIFINVETYHYNNTIHPEYAQCDNDNNGIVTFDLTTLVAQLSTTNSVEFYTSVTNAETQQNGIANPAAFSVNVQGTSIPIFIREIVPNDCDTIHLFSLRTFSNCNVASNCQGANSLCGSLGIPFQNTINVASGGSSGCLGTTPNPTWFFMPVSQPGNINLKIEQSFDINFSVANLDVDYAIYGPFTDPLSACSQVSPSTIVSCSYSAAPVEFPVISNAQAGQYYLIMVTNFSNQSGYIKISDLGSGQATLDCSGMRFHAFLDSNNNGTKETGESYFPLGQFTYEQNNNGIIHNSISPLGFLTLYDLNSSNTYDVSYSVNPLYASMYNVSPNAYSDLSVVSGGGTANYYFPVTVVQPYTDVSVSIIPMSAPRPGFSYTNRVVYSNNGNQTVASGTITFTKDTNVTITSVQPVAVPLTSTGFDYNYTNLLPFETRSFDVTMLVPVPPTVNAGDYLTNTAHIEPLSGDVVPENNDFALTQLVINSYDPNDKTESHGREIVHATFTSDDYLYYTIRFENTGNASAINVRINDVLDSKLDEGSLMMVSSSHSYVMDRVGSSVNWRFDAIFLPVSVANTSIGKGYITFKIKPKAGFAVGDIIPNTASIYFDFNPAIVTNTTLTEFVAPLSNPTFSANDFMLFPNPADDSLTLAFSANIGTIGFVEISDVTGKKVLAAALQVSDSQTLDVSNLQSGIYLVTVTNTNGEKAVRKLIKK